MDSTSKTYISANDLESFQFILSELIASNYDKYDLELVNLNSVGLINRHLYYNFKPNISEKYTYITVLNILNYNLNRYYNTDLVLKKLSESKRFIQIIVIKNLHNLLEYVIKKNIIFSWLNNESNLNYCSMFYNIKMFNRFLNIRTKLASDSSIITCHCGFLSNKYNLLKKLIKNKEYTVDARNDAKVIGILDIILKRSELTNFNINIINHINYLMSVSDIYEYIYANLDKLVLFCCKFNNLDILFKLDRQKVSSSINNVLRNCNFIVAVLSTLLYYRIVHDNCRNLYKIIKLITINTVNSIKGISIYIYKAIVEINSLDILDILLKLGFKIDLSIINFICKLTDIIKIKPLLELTIKNISPKDLLNLYVKVAKNKKSTLLELINSIVDKIPSSTLTIAIRSSIANKYCK